MTKTIAPYKPTSREIAEDLLREALNARWFLADDLMAGRVDFATAMERDTDLAVAVSMRERALQDCAI